MSSSGVFPNNGENIACAYHPVDELHPKRPDNEYSLSKYIGELMAERVSRETGLRISIVRPSHVLSGRSIFDQFTVGRVCAILKAGQAGPGTEMYMADRNRTLARDRGAGRRIPISRAPSGTRPGGPGTISRTTRGISRIASCARCGLRMRSASRSTAAPRPLYVSRKAPGCWGKVTGREPLEVTVPVRWMYDHDITKAKTLIGYRPKGDLDTMMASAAASEAGAPDYRW